MLVNILRAKISRCRVTSINLHYEGSISIDEEIIKAAGLYAGELVHVLNLNNGSRIETYLISAPSGSKIVELNGPAARTAIPGDEIIILAYALVPLEDIQKHKIKFVKVSPQNNSIEKIY